MVVAYHKVNEYGQDIASLGRVDPTLALWGPFVLFAALILWMYRQLADVPGGQPIGGARNRLCQDYARGDEAVSAKRKPRLADVAATGTVDAV